MPHIAQELVYMWDNKTVNKDQDNLRYYKCYDENKTYGMMGEELLYKGN